MSQQITVSSAQPYQVHVALPPSAPPKEGNAGSLQGRNVDPVRAAVSDGYKRSAIYYLKVAAIVISTATMVFAANIGACAFHPALLFITIPVSGVMIHLAMEKIKSLAVEYHNAGGSVCG